MTRSQIENRQYTTKQSAVRAMWSYVRQLQCDGVHTGALSGDNGTSAMWTSNEGRTQYASVDHDNNYYVSQRKWHVIL